MAHERLDGLGYARIGERRMMRHGAWMLAPLLALLPQHGADAAERRCGWLLNPTPANVYLLDRDGEWVISIQGGYVADGYDDMPDMSRLGWVETNVHYGHGCACMTVVTDRRDRRVVKVLSAQPRPLSQCRADRSLPRP